MRAAVCAALLFATPEASLLRGKPTADVPAPPAESESLLPEPAEIQPVTKDMPLLIADGDIAATKISKNALQAVDGAGFSKEQTTVDYTLIGEVDQVRDQIEANKGEVSVPTPAQKADKPAAKSAVPAGPKEAVPQTEQRKGFVKADPSHVKKTGVFNVMTGSVESMLIQLGKVNGEDAEDDVDAATDADEEAAGEEEASGEEEQEQAEQEDTEDVEDAADEEQEVAEADEAAETAEDEEEVTDMDEDVEAADSFLQIAADDDKADSSNAQEEDSNDDAAIVTDEGDEQNEEDDDADDDQDDYVDDGKSDANDE